MAFDLLRRYFNVPFGRKAERLQLRFTRGVIDLAADALLDLPRQTAVYRVDHERRIVAVTEESPHGPRALGVHGSSLVHAITEQARLVGPYQFFVIFQEGENQVIQEEPSAARLTSADGRASLVIETLSR